LDSTPEVIETDLADLRTVTLGELRQRRLQEALAPFQDDLISQVERPRINIGTGPPGRAD
jgi:hypothetical protein